MINRRVTRTIYGGVETTDKTGSINSSTLAFPLTTAQFFYVGFYGKFSARYFHLGVANTNPATLSIDYWDGSAWFPVEDKIDQTNGLTQSGFIHWNNLDDWKASAQSPIADVDLYWIRISTSANLSAGTTLQAVVNLYCDNEMVRAYYPELISDTRYLPTNRTDFLEQYQAAKDLVVLRARQRKLIQDESQIIDLNDVAAASVHAAAKIILQPIATSDEMRQRLKDASDEFDNEIGQLSLSVDQNADGVVDDSERADIGETWVMRR